MNKTDQKILKKFCNDFWFAPNDILLRSIEERIWRDVDFAYPVLDIGCGDGRIGKDLFWNKRSFDVGLDADIKEIENAKKLKMYKKLVVADAADIPMKARSFHSIISNSTFEHIENDEQAIAEVSRVLRKNGKFYMTTTTDRLEKTFKNELNPKGFKHLNERLAHYHYRSLDEWKKILKKNNLALIEHKFYLDDEDIKHWITLFKIATFKPYKRELWSYLKDSKVSTFVPRNIVANITFEYFKNYYKKQLFTKKGNWIYLVAQKQ